MAENRPGPEWSSDWVQCSIINNSGSTLTLGTPTSTSGTTSTGGGSFEGPTASIPANGPEDKTTSVWAFTAYGESGWPSGCGGTVTYHFTNGDLLVLQYNCSVTGEITWCIPLLQAAPGTSSVGSGSYFCTATDATGVSEVGAIITIAPLSEAGNS